MYETLLLISQAVKSGVPLSSAIRLTAGDPSQRGNEAFLRLATLLDQGIEPKVAAAQSGLPASVVDLLDTALASGDFAGTFDELAKLEVSRSLTIHRVVQALAYPLLLFASTVFLFGIIFVIVVPQFEHIFNDFDSRLPAMTAGMIQISHLVRSSLFYLISAAVIAALYVAVKFLFSRFFPALPTNETRTPLYVAVRFLFSRFWLYVPVLGNIGRCLYTARILRQMANHVLRNVPLPDALEQCGKTMRNSAYRKDCRSAADAARRGMPFWEIALRYYWLFPAWLAPMLTADHAQESLSKSLRRAAETVDQQRDTSILLLQSLSLPFFIILLAYMISFFVMAMFMPMICLITDLSA